jgi:SAM-dependent methyltransferase
MFETYRDIFDLRGMLYNRATRACPEARSEERRLMLERLRLDGARRLCDLPAGGGYLADGIDRGRFADLEVVCVEPSSVFARDVAPGNAVLIAAMGDLPLSAGACDRVGSLAGIHHLTDKRPFFSEVSRILAPGGVACVADVAVGTPVAAFLNDAVDRHTQTGHQGLFLHPGELSERMAEAGLSPLAEEHLACPWTFASRQEMAEFCRDLFGMVRADSPRVREELEAALPVHETPAGVTLGWSLTYAVATKA